VTVTLPARPALAAHERGARGIPRRRHIVPTAVLILGAVYTLFPVLWIVIASTKNRAELFSTSTLVPSLGSGFFDNVRELSDYEGGRFWTWGLNSLLYAGVGGALSTLVAASAGFALAKYRFAGRDAVFSALLAGVLVPGITLAIPQYLLISKVGLANTYWSVLLPTLISPYAIYLSRIYAAAAIPDEMVEAARLDGASEFGIFRVIAIPVMMPGLITVFLLQFVAVWNNFLLPYIMLSDDRRFPLTVGLFSLLNQGASQPALYTLVITGALLSIVPLIIAFLVLQRYWRMDLVSGGVKG
jgi:multiple sugar transport system permease protein